MFKVIRTYLAYLAFSPHPRLDLEFLGLYAREDFGFADFFGELSAFSFSSFSISSITRSSPHSPTLFMCGVAPRRGLYFSIGDPSLGLGVNLLVEYGWDFLSRGGGDGKVLKGL